MRKVRSDFGKNIVVFNKKELRMARRLLMAASRLDTIMRNGPNNLCKLRRKYFVECRYIKAKSPLGQIEKMTYRLRDVLDTAVELLMYK